MDKDYPAAHSMDTMWFAVDEDGHIAFMDSGEEGPVPAQFIQTFEMRGGYDGMALVEDLANHLNRTVEEDQYGMPKPQSVGLFYYVADYPDVPEEEGLPITNYDREEPPSPPLKLADLPPQLAEKVGRMKLPGVSFSTAKKIQPAELMFCETWGEEYTHILDTNGVMQPLPPDYYKGRPAPTQTPEEKKPWWKRFFGG